MGGEVLMKGRREGKLVRTHRRQQVWEPGSHRDDPGGRIIKGEGTKGDIVWERSARDRSESWPSF